MLPENPGFWGWVYFFVFPSSVYAAFGLTFTEKVIKEDLIKEVFALNFFGSRIEYNRKIIKYEDISKVYDFGEKEGIQSGVNIAITGNYNMINLSTNKECDKKALKYIIDRIDTKLVDEDLRDMLKEKLC